MSKALALLAWCCLSFVAPAFGSDLTGIWTGHTVDRNGDQQDVSFRFDQRNSVLSGKMYGDNESTPIAEGIIEGDEVRFVVTTELNGSITKTQYTGRLRNGEIEVTRSRLGNASPDKPSQKQTFVLKRL